MKKLFIVGSKWCYSLIPSIENRLKQLGYEVIRPNYYDDPLIEEKIKCEMTKEKHVAFCKESFDISRNKVKNSDATLVLNFDQLKNGTVYENYIGGATFLEMYNTYLEQHPIFLYNQSPIRMTYSDEIEGMDPIILDSDLFKILEIDDVSTISDCNNLLNYFDKESLQKIKNCSDEYLKAAVIVRCLFKDKVDKSNQPYINHLLRVSDSLETFKQKVAGLLHDVVEDTEVTCKDLMEVGFSSEVVKIVYIVTKPNIDTSKMTQEEKLALYDSEIDGVISSNNYDASKLKEKDMTDNYNPKRMAMLPEEKQEWFHKKYGKQLVKLKQINKEREKC